MLDASSFTTWSILIVSILLPFYVFATFYFSGASKKKSIKLAVITALWGALIFWAVKSDLRGLIGPAGPALVLVALVIPVGVVYKARHYLTQNDLSQFWLVGLQLARVLGGVFLIEMVRGNIPGIFAHPAGWGDITVGVLAFGVLCIGFSKKKIPNWGIWAVAILGITDFVSAYFFGFTTGATPLQLFSFEMPNLVILYPTGLIPMLLVPIAIGYHILSLTMLKKTQKEASR